MLMCNFSNIPLARCVTQNAARSDYYLSLLSITIHEELAQVEGVSVAWIRLLFMLMVALVQDRSNIETTQPTSQQLKQLSKSSSHLKVTNTE